ncbi:MAG: hypothetical protein M3R49_00980 [Chloroflexota bacterium]|nr:hypothetical protein [Chloroflexota bacterium]
MAPERRPRRPISPAAAAGWLSLALVGLAVGWGLPLDDFWLTIASGRLIASGADPAHALPFTFTPMREGALNPQWLVQVVWSTLPVGGALALHAALVLGGLAVALWLALGTSSRRATALAALLTIAVLGPHLLPRTQSFSIALFPIAVALLDRFASRPWMPIAYGLLMIVWANVHGAFVIGELVAAGYVVGAVLPSILPGSAALGSRELRHRALALGLSIVAPLLNPAGFDLLVYAYTQSADPVVRAVSTEWQPAWPWLPIAMPLWLLLAALVVLRSWRGIGVPQRLVALGLLALALMSVRSIPWFVLFALPALAMSIDRLLGHRRRIGRAVGAIGSAWEGRGAATLAVAAAAILAFQLVRPLLPAPLARLTTEEPAQLVDVLQAKLDAKGQARIFNEQSWGGYLVYRLDARVQTYLDGRIETAPGAVWRRYYAIIAGDGSVEELRSLDIDWVLVKPVHRRLLDLLDAAGYQRVAESSIGVLLRAPAAA